MSLSDGDQTPTAGEHQRDAVGAEVDLAALDRRLAQLRAEQEGRRERAAARRNLWLAHHWPEHYDRRCIRVGPRPVCRRCAALYPLALVVAVASVAGLPPWPARFDPGIVWLLSLPATVAYGGEALGWFRYRPGWQVATTLLAALAFGRALGYELVARWNPVFWGPIAVFGAIWFAATVVGLRRQPGRRHQTHEPGLQEPGLQEAGLQKAGRQRAAAASSSSSSVL